MTKTALITGITGQDGSYLAELLLDKGYEVHGLIRPSATFPTRNIDHLRERDDFRLHYGDMLDGGSLRELLEFVEPDEVYNLAAQSHVRVSFQLPEYTTKVIALGTLNLLEAVRQYQWLGRVRVYQASSSEMFGNEPAPQDESTPFNPQSPYACAKVFAHQLCQNYREAYGMHISCGILFNHESPRRSPRFVTRKITKGFADIVLGRATELRLGNLYAVRDWGWAPDYVKAMWLMLQQDKPDDYVIATGEGRTVYDWLFTAAEYTSMKGRYAIDAPMDFVVIDDNYKRPTEVHNLRGDWTKARRKLGWRPETSFNQMVQRMVEHDLQAP